MEIVLSIMFVALITTLVGYMMQDIKGKFAKQEKYQLHILDKLNKQYKTQKKRLSFVKDYLATSMPIVTIRLFKNEYKFILDTGADFNALDREAFERIIKENNLSISMKDLEEGMPVVGGEEVFGVGGIQSSVRNIELPFVCDEQEFREEFSIVSIGAPLKAYEDKGIKLCGVIGSPFFNKNKWILDFEELVVWTNSDKS